MTRKRCVKLLMASGYDRNGANRIATIAMNAYGSYSKGYREALEFKKKIHEIDFETIVKSIGRAFTALGEAMDKMAEGLTRVIDRGITTKEATKGFLGYCEETKSRP